MDNDKMLTNDIHNLLLKERLLSTYKFHPYKVCRTCRCSVLVDVEDGKTKYICVDETCKEFGKWC